MKEKSKKMKSKPMSRRNKLLVIWSAVILVSVGVLLLTGVVSASTGSTNVFTVNTYIASGELYVSVSPVNSNLVSGSYQILAISQGAIEVYNGTFTGSAGTSFTIPAQYPTLQIEIIKGGTIVQQQTIQGMLISSSSGGSSGFTILDAGIMESMFVLTLIIGMMIFERRQQNKDKLPDEYHSSMDEGDMLMTKELFKNPANTKSQGDDRMKMYLWLKDNGYEINPTLKKPAKRNTGGKQ